MAKKIYEVNVVRENDDEDTVYLCLPCLKSTDDFLKVKSKKVHEKDGLCDRCN